MVGVGRDCEATFWLTALISKPSIKALYISEYTLPVWFLEPDHVLHLQQGVDASQGLCLIKSKGEVMPPILCLQSKPVKILRVKRMNEGAKSKPIIPAC